MCWVCEKYGDGGKWYFNPKNYARRLYKVRKDTDQMAGAEADTQGEHGMRSGAIKKIMLARLERDPEKEKRVIKEMEDDIYRVHFGQVVTLEEILKIVEIAYPLAKMTCNCRRVWRGKPDEDNFTCMGIGPGMYKWERWPETYRGGVEFLTPDEAKEFMRAQNKAGRVHTVDLFGAPFIGGLCQCEYPTCVGIRYVNDYGYRFFLKGEYVAKVDRERCNGCKKCLTRCQFKSMNFEISEDRAFVEMMRCYGCGLCATSCPKEAIRMVDRSSLPGLRDNW